MIIFIIIVAVVYYLFFLIVWIGLFRLDKKKNKKVNFISVIVAARNEEKNIKNLIECLIKQKYDKYEIIIANDRSKDKTEEILKEYEKNDNFKYINVKESSEYCGKKNALRQAIEISRGAILAFTDADCYPGELWLEKLNECYVDNVDVVAGVSPLYKNIFEESGKIKNMERYIFSAITAGSLGSKIAITCTARNFSYTRKLYDEVNGFSGIGHIASGDDDLMLMKMRGKSKKMNFCMDKEGFVKSLDKTNFKDSIDLETRRASKFRYYGLVLQTLLIFIFIFYLILIALSFLSFYNVYYFKLFIVLFLLKVAFESLLIISFLIRIKEIKRIFHFFVIAFLYMPYFILISLKGTFGNFKWKE